MIAVIRRVVGEEIARLVHGEVGEVVEVDWKQQRARVRIAGSETETSWLAIGTGFASGGDGAVAPIAMGDRVWVAFLGGRPREFGVILARVYGANGAPDVPEGTWGVVRGSRKILFGADGKTEFKVQELKVEAEGEVSINGTVVKLGDATDAAVKYEALALALSSVVPTTWVGAVTVAFQALGVTLPPMDIS
ncbi:MAG: phage baseplate assembly protein V, partial [Candidatus Methylomirabilota bacterium]